MLWHNANVQRATLNVQPQMPEERRTRVDTAQANVTLVALDRRGSQVVRQRSAKPLFAGSIPAPASFARREIYLAKRFRSDGLSTQCPVAHADSACDSGTQPRSPAVVRTKSHPERSSSTTKVSPRLTVSSRAE